MSNPTTDSRDQIPVEAFNQPGEPEQGGMKADAEPPHDNRSTAERQRLETDDTEDDEEFEDDEEGTEEDEEDETDSTDVSS